MLSDFQCSVVVFFTTCLITHTFYVCVCAYGCVCVRQNTTILCVCVCVYVCVCARQNTTVVVLYVILLCFDVRTHTHMHTHIHTHARTNEGPRFTSTWKSKGVRCSCICLCTAPTAVNIEFVIYIVRMFDMDIVDALAFACVRLQMRCT